MLLDLELEEAELDADELELGAELEEAELDVTEALELETTELGALEEWEPNVSPSFTSTPTIRTSVLTATASGSTSTPTRGACTSTSRSRLDEYKYEYKGRQGKEGKGMRKGDDRPVNMCWRWQAYGGGRSSHRCSSRSRRGVGAVLGAKTQVNCVQSVPRGILP
jgi:hypothetical protein